MEGKPQTHTWQELLESILEDSHEKLRIARAVRVNPVTLQRWVNKESKPREENMRQLLKAVPRTSSKQFAQLVSADFPNLVQEEATAVKIPLTPPSDFYARVLSAYANTPESLFPQAIYDLILQQAIEHLDPERRGISVSIVRCMPPSKGGKIRSLREIGGMGTSPWKKDLEHKTVFLGAESLAGAAVTECRKRIVRSREEILTHYSAHWVEYEQSAVACPIMCKNKIMGCLLVASAVADYFSDVLISIAECYANLVALAFKLEDFFDIKDIDLHFMPNYSLQEARFHDFNQRVTQKFAEAHSEKKLITLHEAQAKVFQEIEEELLLLPPYTEG